ncbi:hypothetical protein [Aurantiacibacter flavus]|uniref:DUF2059 domain-containing protein n=1 Tax=Aurantiacibacter flavus TaxID=3145232 RepID=A0ABV0CX91_9SPHN
MKLFFLLAAAFAATTLATPALAQDGSSQGVAEMEALGAMFPVEPLTPEEEARLPAAKALVEMIMPDGTMGEMMNGMFEGMLGPIMAMDEAGREPPLAELLGVSGDRLESIDNETAARAAAILDPDWRLRDEREAEALPRAMNAMMTAMEPALKAAMAEMYAVSFNAAELRDIDAFFSTESGATYARKSFTMASDPRYVGAIMQAMPQALAGMANMQAELDAATADLATPRSWYELEPAEQDKLARLLGVSREELGASVNSAEGEDAHDH